MILVQLIRKAVSSIFLWNIVRRYKRSAALMKIKAAQAYVLGVQKTRLFFMGVLLLAVSFVFLVNGLSLIQAAFFTYSMWSNETKFVVALLLGGVEFFGAVGIFIYMFREETWSRYAEIDKVVNSVIQEQPGKKKD